MDTQGRGMIVRDWLILFVPGPHRGWHDYFTRPEFRHVYAMTHYPEIDKWLVVDWSSSGFTCEHLPHDDAMINLALCKDAGYRVLAVKSTMDRAKKVTRYPRFPVFCVSFIKHLTGITTFFPITPFQLYRHLTKTGASQIF